MKINIVVNAWEPVREKIKYGFALLLYPFRAEITFGNSFPENAINILYGNQPPSKKALLCLTSSKEFEDCVRDSRPPDISHFGWFEFKNKRLPKLFPVPRTGPVGTDFFFDFDIAAATFMLASEFQDLISLERDEFDRLRAMDSLQDKLGILDLPVVNYYSMFLKKKVEESFGVRLESKKYGEEDHALALTHDVDYTSSLNLRMIRRNILGHAILNNDGLTPNERAMKLLYPLFAIAGYDPPKSGLKFLRRMETQKKLKSTFFIKTGATAKQDVNYNYDSRPFGRFVNSLTDNGFEIGIHPSMKTYIDGEQLHVEKARLEKLAGKQINSVRQHYLKFTAGKTIGIWEKAGLRYDSTLGFSRKAGFRNSVAFPFPLYNFEKDRISTVTELPLIIMDGTFADNRTVTPDETFDKMKKLVDETKAAHGAASILFHNSLTDPIDFPGYKKIFDRLLTEAENDGFKMDSLSEIIEGFR
jgi:hypothetical protein